MYSLWEMFGMPLQEPVNIFDYEGSIDPGATIQTTNDGIPVLGFTQITGIVFVPAGDPDVTFIFSQGIFDSGGVKIYDRTASSTIPNGLTTNSLWLTPINIVGKFAKIELVNTSGVLPTNVRASIFLRSRGL